MSWRLTLVLAAASGISNALRPHEKLDDTAMAYALQLVRDRPGVVIDVGANNGKQSMMALLARRRVFAIECLSSAYTDLLHIFRNVSADNITIVHACAGRKLELSVLNLADDSSSLFQHNVGMGREAEKHMLVMQRESRSTESALVLPLDLLFRTETVVLVKVDTQGAEESVLGGMQRILQQRPVVMYEETNRFIRAAGSSYTDVMVLLQPLGYTCKSFCDKWCSKVNALALCAIDAPFALIAHVRAPTGKRQGLQRPGYIMSTQTVVKWPASLHTRLDRCLVHLVCRSARRSVGLTLTTHGSVFAAFRILASYARPCLALGCNFV